MKTSLQSFFSQLMKPVKREHRKTLMVAQYILDKSKTYSRPTVTAMKLNTMVYIAHGYMLGRHGRPLLDEPIMAWETGPFVKGVYLHTRQYKSQPVERLVHSDFQYLTDIERSILDEIVNVYNGFPAVQIRQSTHHSDTPWYQTWYPYEQSTPISNDLIEFFYKDILSKQSFSSL